MKLKMFKPSQKAAPQLAVNHEEKWYALKDILKAAKMKLSKNDDQLIHDMVSFLAAGETVHRKLNRAVLNLIEGDAKKKIKSLSQKLKPCMPFQPLSFRDFLLSEEHFINSKRGYVKRFMPGLSRVTGFYEMITRRTFPAFKPGKVWYEKPVYYMGNHLNCITTGETVAFPSYSKALDYELEMGALIVKPLKNATPEEAREAIGGFVIVNDFSARDVQKAEMEGGLGPMKSKHFKNAISDVVTTADDIFSHINELKGEVRINDDVILTTSFKGAQYSIEEAVAFASLEEQLYPGELVATGTWPGGCALENGHWVQPGDRLNLSIEGIGELVHCIEYKGSE